MSEIRRAQIFRLESIIDLIRLVVSNSQNRGGYLYYGKKDNKYIFAISHLVPSWYDLRGLPVTLTAEVEETPETNLIQYRYPDEGEKETWDYVSHINNNPKNVYLPIIRVKEFPNFMI